jgi:group I intron endonuclease
MFYIIYKITNLLNSKFYIGITSESLNHRFKGHVRKSNFGSTSNFHQALKKYGKENFKKEIIFSFETEDKKHAYSIEQKYIDKYQAVSKGYNMDKFGWNITDRRGEKNPMYGKLSGNAKKLVVFGKIYLSATEAAKYLKKSPKTISGWARSSKEKDKHCFYIQV